MPVFQIELIAWWSRWLSFFWKCHNKERLFLFQIWAGRDEHGTNVCCVIFRLRGGQFNVPLTGTLIGSKTKLHQLLQSEILVGQTNLITSHYSGQRLIQLLTDLIKTKERKHKLGWTGAMSLPHLWLKYLCLFHTKSCTNIWKAFFVTGLTYKTTNKLANNARLDLTAEPPNY